MAKAFEILAIKESKYSKWPGLILFGPQKWSWGCLMMFDTEECVLLQVTIRTFVRGLSGEEDTGQGPLNSIVRKSNDSEYLILVLRWSGYQWSSHRTYPMTLTKHLLSLSKRKRKRRVKNQSNGHWFIWPLVPVTSSYLHCPGDGI